MADIQWGNPLNPAGNTTLMGQREAEQQRIAQERAAQEAADPENVWKAQYSNYMKANQGGLPTQPAYQGFTGADGMIDPRFKMTARPDIAFNSNLGGLESRLDGNQLDMSGVNELKNRATATGPSSWAQLMLQNQGLDQANATDELGRQQNAGMASAYSGLATRGGMSAGARERIASKSMLSGLMGKQQLMRAGEQARTGINIQDQANQLDLLKQLPGAQLNAANFGLAKTNTWAGMAGNENALQQALKLANRNYATDVESKNIDTLKTDVQGRNSYAQDKWKTDADAWKAMMQAGAQQWG